MRRAAHSKYTACYAFCRHRTDSSRSAQSLQGVTAYLLGSCGSQLLCQRLFVLHRLLRGCVGGLQGSLGVHVARMQRLVGRLQRLQVRRSLAEQLCKQRISAR